MNLKSFNMFINSLIVRVCFNIVKTQRSKKIMLLTLSLKNRKVPKNAKSSKNEIHLFITEPKVPTMRLKNFQKCDRIIIIIIIQKPFGCSNFWSFCKEPLLWTSWKDFENWRIKNVPPHWAKTGSVLHIWNFVGSVLIFGIFVILWKPMTRGFSLKGNCRTIFSS